MKAELLRVLSKQKNKKINIKKQQVRRPQKKLSQPELKVDPPSSDRNGSYKQRRPPELHDFAEEQESNAVQVQSARV